MPNQDRRHPVAVSGRVAAEQQERSNLSQPNVTETEAVDRGGLGELLVERDRGVEVVHEDPGLPERQRTLRATVEWSVGLLTDAERSLLEVAAVFTDGWTVQAAARVAGLEEDRVHYAGGRPGHHHDGRPLVGGEVPRPPRLVIADLARGENAAGNRGPQRSQVAAGDGVRGGHVPLPFLDAHSSPGTAKR